MTHVELGHQGAKRQSFSAKNPRQLLLSIIDKIGENEADVFNQFKSAIDGDNDYLDVIIDYWFANNFLALVKRSKPNDRNPTALRTIKTEFRQRLTDHIKREANILMLNTLMPSGLTLGESTFGACLKLGGLYSKIGKRGKPNQLVGKYVTDAQLKILQGIK